MSRRIFLLLLFSFASAASAQILDTEVWVGRVEWEEGKIAIGELKNVSRQHPGYDNQPAFFPDGTTLVYTTEETSLDDSGRGVHAVRVDLKTGKATPLRDARGFSPTPAADGKQLMLLREGRVWLHDVAGKERTALTETKDAGYFTRFDEKTWVLFLNNEQRPIVIYEDGRMETVATLAQTAPYRVPGARAVTFVAEEEGKRVLRRLELETKRVTTLAAIPFATGGQHVWTPRNTILIASGNTIYEWSAASPDRWTPVYRTGDPELQGITRIALSPAADRIALVSTARAETTIRNARSASNRAIAAHDVERFASFFRADAKVTAASGQELEGREAIGKALAAQIVERPNLAYVRTPNAIEIDGDVAEERGTWTGWWGAGEGRVEVRGTYSATWRREAGASGTPSWSIATERFVRTGDETPARERRIKPE